MNRRPMCGGSEITTPRNGGMLRLLGPGMISGPVCLTGDEFRAIKKLYNFEPEKDNEKPEQPVPPKREDFTAGWKYQEALTQYERTVKNLDNWTDPKPFMQAGADRNAIRHAEADGIRLLAWLARYVEPGQDPLKLLVQMARDSGFDVDPQDMDWCE